MFFIFLIFLNITLSKILIEEEKIFLLCSLALKEKEIEEGTYLLSGSLNYKKDKIGEATRIPRIYFPCKKEICNYDFKIEVFYKDIKENFLLEFLNKKNFNLNLNLKEINKNIKKSLNFSFGLLNKDKNFTFDVSNSLINIENINLNLKEKPSIKMSLKILNPFNFNFFIEKIILNFKIDEFKLEREFDLKEELSMGEKIKDLDLPIKEDLLLYILTKKFLQEDISRKISGSYEGEIVLKFKNYEISIPFKK